ncbi:MAG: RNA 2',3'-cyclic phosphodiesterase [Patescibacteria group bacterium]|nr:RNA 2',3'-cyclic phosphodiesterase [Patescibacteria group bacterium]
MKKRIFIAINLPDDIKRELLSYEKRWRNLKVRWTNFNKMHLTIEFLGEVNKSGLDAVLSAVEKTALKTKPFDIRLDKIVLGPDPVQAKMFWVTIYLDSYLLAFKNLMAENLKQNNFIPEEREFKPHITLARARGNQLKGKQTKITLAKFKFKAEGVEVMQSQLHPGGAKYKAVESFNFFI